MTREPLKMRRGLEGAIKALKKLEANDTRLREDATEEERHLVFEARKTILQVMMKPTRWSQMRLHAAAMIIDEVCGKLAEKLDAKLDTKVEVIVHQDNGPDDEDDLRAAAEEQP